MRRILLPAALVLALSGGFALAQQTQAPQPPDQQQAPTATQRHHGGEFRHHARDPHKAAAFLSKKLNLTPDQTAKIEPILADRSQKVSALMADTQTTPEDRKKQFHAIQKDTEQQLAGVLTPDQMQQMKAMRHGRHGKGHAGPTSEPTPPSA